MLKINPTIVLETADELSKQNIEYVQIYDRVCECISRLKQMKGLEREIHYLYQTNQDFNNEVLNHKKYTQVLLSLTEHYVESDNRALLRAEGSPFIRTVPVDLSKMIVPAYNNGILF